MINLTSKQKKALEQWNLTCLRIKKGTKRIPNETEKEKEARIKSLLEPTVEGFERFVNYYFSEDGEELSEFGWFQKEGIHDVIVCEEPHNTWEWSRESAKSVIADIFIPIHKLVTNKLDGMILGSENSDKASKLIGDVQAQLTSNQRLLHDFGEFGISGSWVSGYFQTKEGVGFWSFGVGQNPAGVRNGFRRPNYGVIDDADNKDKAKNQELTLQRLDWILGEFMGCLSTKGYTFIYANNRVHRLGLTAHMVGDIDESTPKREGWKHIKVYFTEDPTTHEMLLLEDGGVPSWKENFTREQAKNKIIGMGRRNALRQLYHQHVEEGNVFTDENMPWGNTIPLHKYDALVSYCDPAFGESGKGCWRFVVLMGKIGLDYHIIWVWGSQKGDFATIQYQLAEMIEKKDPVFYGENKHYSDFKEPAYCQFWTEGNNLQKSELQKVYMLYKMENDVNWRPKFDQEPKGDKIGRIEAMETTADYGHLIFNTALKGNKHMEELRSQFKGFPKGFIDGPDTVQGGKSKLDKKTKSSGSIPRTGSYRRNYKRMA